jgi:hypothetical protein
VQFEVNGQVYVLAMLPPDGELGLFAPTQAGLKRLPIYDDGGRPAPLVALPPQNDGKSKRVN